MYVTIHSVRLKTGARPSQKMKLVALVLCLAAAASAAAVHEGTEHPLVPCPAEVSAKVARPIGIKYYLTNTTMSMILHSEIKCEDIL